MDADFYWSSNVPLFDSTTTYVFNPSKDETIFKEIWIRHDSPIDTITLCLDKISNYCEEIECNDCCIEIVRAEDCTEPINLDEFLFGELNYNINGGCTTALPNDIYCTNIEISLAIQNSEYSDNEGIWFWSASVLEGNASSNDIEWTAGAFSASSFQFHPR